MGFEIFLPNLTHTLRDKARNQKLVMTYFALKFFLNSSIKNVEIL